MVHEKIQEYNTNLVNNMIEIKILDYVKTINALGNNINIDFIDEFIGLVGNNTFCIPHIMLQTYGVLTNIDNTTHIKTLLEQNNFKVNKDYLVTNVCHQLSSGTKYKNEYLLKPRTFKLCLMRAKNIKNYAYYYLLLEECISYYNEYKNAWNKKYITQLKERVTERSNVIDKLQESIDILNKDREIQKKNYEDQMKKYDNQMKIQEKDRKVQKKNHKEQMKKSDEILKNNVDLKKDSKRTKKQLNNITEELVESREKIDNITEEFNEKIDNITEELEDNNKITKAIAKKLDIAVIDRVMRTNKSSTIEYFVIMKSDTNIEYKYYIIRGQKKNIIKKINELEGYYKIKSIECVPNAITLFNLIKEKLKHNIKYSNNRLNLININENDFLEKIDNIYDERKIIEINN